MTEYSPYRPDTAPQGVPQQQERLVFVPQNDRHGREFEIAAAAANQGKVINGDSPEVNEMVEEASREAQEARDLAASRTPEHIAEDAELTQAIGWNAQTIHVTREYAEVNGL